MALAAHGAAIAINDKDETATHDVLEELTAGAPAIAVPADITNRATVQQMVGGVAEHFSSMNILVSNAGILFPTAVAEIEEDEWDAVMDVNLKGTFLCSQAAIPAMKKPVGDVLSTSLRLPART